MATRPLAYSLVRVDPPRDMRSAAELMCAGCPTTQKIPIVALGNSPEWIGKMFARLGWDCNIHKASANFCPKCVKARQTRVLEPAPPKPERVLPTLPRAPGLMDSIKLGAGTRTHSSPKEEHLAIKDLSTEQKAALRRALDANFDDSTGRYINDVSDHSISEKLGIPRATVIEFREASYGELKDDPEITGLQMQIADCKRILTNLQSTIAKMETKLEAVRRKVGL